MTRDLTAILLILILILNLMLPAMAFAQEENKPPVAAAVSETATEANNVIRFEDYFLPKTLRVDYLLAGDATTETGFFLQMKEEPYWGGPHKNLVDPFGYGTYRYSVFDSASGKLLFRRGFSTLFQEWRGTAEAKKMRRAYTMTAVMPFPKQAIRFVIEQRSYATNEFEVLFERIINPTDYFINRENITPFKVTKLKDSGTPQDHVDVAFLAEGYTTLEMDKFLQDARRISEYFLSVEPYASSTAAFNFYAIESPSIESGVTIPGSDIYVKTNINSSFYTFGMDRYLTTSDTKSMYDIASNVPYDVIFVLVNSKRYGGGGFYNHYGQSTVDHQLSNIVAIHEFGHQFAGLADEYYAAEVTYSDYYNLKFEPWEPNITTNVNFDSKWKKMVSPGTPLPTPRKDENKGLTGMFEGGGYLSKGIYSPMMDCRMKSNEPDGFCPVCREGIRRMIDFYKDK